MVRRSYVSEPRFVSARGTIERVKRYLFPSESQSLALRIGAGTSATLLNYGDAFRTAIGRNLSPRTTFLRNVGRGSFESLSRTNGRVSPSTWSGRSSMLMVFLRNPGERTCRLVANRYVCRITLSRNVPFFQPSFLLLFSNDV